MLPLVPTGKSSFLFSTTTRVLWLPTPLQNSRPAAVPDHKCGCCSFHHPALPSCCPDVLHNHFFPPFHLVFLSHQIFSPVHSAGTATFLHTGQSDAEAGGNSWERPCISCSSPTYSHCTTFSVCDKQLCCSIRNIFKSGLHCTLGYAKNLHCFIL